MAEEDPPGTYDFSEFAAYFRRRTGQEELAADSAEGKIRRHRRLVESFRTILAVDIRAMKSRGVRAAISEEEAAQSIPYLPMAEMKGDLRIDFRGNMICLGNLTNMKLPDLIRSSQGKNARGAQRTTLQQHTESALYALRESANFSWFYNEGGNEQLVEFTIPRGGTTYHLPGLGYTLGKHLITPGQFRSHIMKELLFMAYFPRSIDQSVGQIGYQLGSTKGIAASGWYFPHENQLLHLIKPTPELFQKI